MNVVEDIKWKFNELQPKFMDVIFVFLNNKIYGPFLEEAVYFLPLSSQKFLVHILST